MGTIVCQTCNCTIEHFEDEKVTRLYSKCKDGECQANHEDLD
ncbi:GapA-binding peptide SR1P [Priestia aryabhattai]|nr:MULTISPECIES: GapA-binding peptide SR1P [Bacillaceae]MDT2047497.1 GapA-binding peptide SR1P [Priestia flexa]OZT12395.1 GapA-binding peptide SR1P [Priestia aryabhattai]TDB55237.1 GapA-binding peptide SR1P [Bacillus sp. CBEL-1]USY56382.1 GapA-binding peptide SR1P [Bacillus sp. 1780r2a1]